MKVIPQVLLIVIAKHVVHYLQQKATEVAAAVLDPIATINLVNPGDNIEVLEKDLEIVTEKDHQKLDMMIKGGMMTEIGVIEEEMIVGKIENFEKSIANVTGRKIEKPVEEL